MHSFITKFSIKQLVLLLILLIGLLLLLTLVQKQQELRGRAEHGNFNDAIDVVDGNGNKVECNNDFVCTTESKEVTIKSINPNYFLERRKH